jgi:hypothetical protein
MPSISRPFGLVIYMYFNDHSPPHFHARLWVRAVEPLHPDVLYYNLTPAWMKPEVAHTSTAS